MKLLIVTAIRECYKTADAVFDRNGIKKYSLVNVNGVGNNEMPDYTGNWFGHTSMKDEFFDSVMMFCFTDDDTARKTLADLKAYNETSQPEFPVRALILPVEENI
ncbi:hypothetical protein [Leadbetterella sp. DM7]|uniref:hypothetical protein n=1 Tax=Leadbetterella sp. DM7 TaxID=3235085 RepID=UPI00349E7DA9